MSYEYKGEVKELVYNNLDKDLNKAFDIRDEVNHVYAQAAKADEYEAKAKVLDRVKNFAEEPPFLLANNENEDYERYAYDQILKLINKYESGDHNV